MEWQGELGGSHKCNVGRGGGGGRVTGLQWGGEGGGREGHGGGVGMGGGRVTGGVGRGVWRGG